MSTVHDVPARPRAGTGRWWRGRRRGAVVVMVLVAAAGLVTGVVLPRGPVTTAQSVTVLVVCAALGLLVGLRTASRWWVLLAPAVFAATFELARLPASGPTVDGIHLGSVYGVIALLAGRGFDTVVMYVPLAVGVVWGRIAARRTVRDAPGHRLSAGGWLRFAGAVVAAALVLVLAAGLLRPATTAPIAGPDGEPLPGSVAELTTVEVGGHEQALMLRGADADNPVLLYLEGGPGGTGIGRMRVAGEALEEDFTVAVWDQRGTGKSISALEPTDTLTVEQMVADTLAVTDHLRERFGQERIYLVGSSWGSTLGVLAVQRAPEKYRAYVGAGQMVDQQETDRRMYAESLAWAERTGTEDLAAWLRANGPPPYEDVLAYPDALSANPEYREFPHGEDYDPASEYPASLFVPEYTLTEQVRGMGGILDTFAVLYPQLQATDFRRDVPALEVPVFVVEGAHESPGRADLAREWFDQLEAPVKEWVAFDRSGHTPHFDEPGRFHEFLVGTVLPRTGGSG